METMSEVTEDQRKWDSPAGTARREINITK